MKKDEEPNPWIRSDADFFLRGTIRCPIGWQTCGRLTSFVHINFFTSLHRYAQLISNEVQIPIAEFADESSRICLISRAFQSRNCGLARPR